MVLTISWPFRCTCRLAQQVLLPVSCLRQSHDGTRGAVDCEVLIPDTCGRNKLISEIPSSPANYGPVRCLVPLGRAG